MIIPKDLSESAKSFQSKLPKNLPESYFSLISRYAFPRFKIPPIFFFANTDESSCRELSERVFLDKYMSSILIKNGLIQIGNSNYRIYDPICFDTRQGLNKVIDYSIVQIDHEGILCHSKVAVKEIASVF